MVNPIESQQDSNTPTSARALRLAQEGKTPPLTESNRNLLRYYGYKTSPDKITTTYNDDDLTRIEVMDDRVNDPVLLNELFGFQKSYSSHTVAQPIIPLTIDKTNDDDLDSSDDSPETSSSGAMVDESESITESSNAVQRSSRSSNGDSENLLDICHVRLIPRDSIQVDRNKSHALADFDLTCGAPVIGDIPLVTYTSDYATGTVIDESSVGELGKDLDSPLNKINLSSASSMDGMDSVVPSDPTEVKPDSNASNADSNNVDGRSESEYNLKIRWVIPEAVESKKASRRSMPCWSDVMRSGWWTLSTDNWTSPYIMVDIDSSDAINRYKNAVDEGLPPASYVILNQVNGHAQFFWLIPPSRRYDDKGHKTDTLGLYELITSTLNWKLDGDVNAHGHRCRNPYYSGCNSSSRLGYSMDGVSASDSIAPAVTIGFYDGNADLTTSDSSSKTDAAGSSPDPNGLNVNGDATTTTTRSESADDEIRVSVFYPDSESDGGIHVWSLSELYYELSALDWINEGRRVINTRKALARRNGAGSLFDGSWSALDPQFIDGEVPEGYRLNATFRVLTWGVWTGHVEPELDAMLQFVRQTLVFDESESSFTDDEIKSACRSVLKFYRAHFNPNHPSRLNDRLTALGEGYGEDVEESTDKDEKPLGDDEIITRGLMRLGLKIDGSDAESVIDVLTNKPVCSKDDLVIDREQRRLLDPRARLSGSRGGSRQSLAQRMAQVDNLAKGRGRKVGEDGLTDSERLVLKAISEVRAGEVSGSLKGNESSRDDAGRLDGILDSMGREEAVINPNLKNGSDSMNDDQDWEFLLRKTPSTLDGSDGGSGEAEDFVVDSDGKPTVDDDPAAGWLAMMAEPVDEERTKVFAVLQHSYDSKMAKSTFYALYRRVVNAAKWRLIREVWKVIKRSFNLWEKKEWSPDNDYWSRPLFWMGKISFAVANQLAPQLARAGYVRSALSCLDAVRSVVRFVDHKMEDESLWVLEPILTVMKHVYIDNGLVHVSGLEEEEDIILPPDLDCSSSGDAVAWMGHGDGRRSRKVDRDDLGSMGVLADYIEWASAGLYELMGKVWITRDTYRGHVLDGVRGFQDVIQALDESSLSLKAVREKSTGGGRAPDEVGMILTGW